MCHSVKPTKTPQNKHTDRPQCQRRNASGTAVARILTLLLVAIIVLTTMNALAYAQKRDALGDQDFDKLIQPSLIASHDSVPPGGRIAVGVRFKIEPKWHIYWRFPGDAGLPTQLRLSDTSLAPASELFWPVPISFVQPGDVTGYGYEDDVLLWGDFDIPADATIGETLPYTMNVTWLACAHVCVPGRTKLSGTVKVGEETRSADMAMFEQWQVKLPQRVEVQQKGAPLEVEVVGGIDKATGSGRFEIGLKPVQGRVTEIVLGRERPMQVSEFKEMQHDGAREVTFVAQIVKGRELQSALLPVLVTLDESGDSRYVEAMIPIFKQ